MKTLFELDRDKCTACGACVIACMDQNDLWPDQGDVPFRRIGTQEKRISIGCMHCEDAPCMEACPVGCLYKDALGLTVCDNTNCIGCRSCEKACPVGAPVFSADGKMRKCDGCGERLANGLEPACVRVCPYGALSVNGLLGGGAEAGPY